MLCANEYQFAQFRSTVERLTLVNSYLSPRLLHARFPNVQDLTIAGGEADEMCHMFIASDLRITLRGCSKGMSIAIANAWV